METIRLPDGKLPDIDTDCIVVQRTRDGKYSMTGSVLSGDESVSFGSAVYETFDAAIEAGTAWASGHGVSKLHVCSVGPDDDLSPV